MKINLNSVGVGVREIEQIVGFWSNFESLSGQRDKVGNILKKVCLRLRN